jgi:hypothetical protein
VSGGNLLCLQLPCRQTSKVGTRPVCRRATPKAVLGMICYWFVKSKPSGAVDTRWTCVLFRYEVQPDGQLKPHKRNVRYTGEAEDRVGPGDYNPSFAREPTRAAVFALGAGRGPLLRPSPVPGTLPWSLVCSAFTPPPHTPGRGSQLVSLLFARACEWHSVFAVCRSGSTHSTWDMYSTLASCLFRQVVAFLCMWVLGLLRAAAVLYLLVQLSHSTACWRCGLQERESC